MKILNKIVINLLDGGTYKVYCIDPAVKTNYLMRRCFKNGKDRPRAMVSTPIKSTKEI